MFIQWLLQHWFEAVQTGGIIAGLLFTAVSMRDSRQTQKISNLFTLTQFHRELYGQLFARPELRRIFRPDVDLSNNPVTEDERLFLTLAILHVNLALQAARAGAIIPIERLEADLAEFFNLPIPKAVWEEIRAFQNPELVTLLDRLTGLSTKRTAPPTNAPN